MSVAWGKCLLKRKGRRNRCCCDDGDGGGGRSGGNDTDKTHPKDGHSHGRASWLLRVKKQTTSLNPVRFRVGTWEYLAIPS